MERKIGEIFEFEGKQYEVCKTNKSDSFQCDDCDMRFGCGLFGNYREDVHGVCCSEKREDNRNVVFKALIPNMKTFND